MADEPKIAYVAKIGPSHLSMPFPAHPPRLSVALFWAKPGRTPDCRSALEKDILAGKRKKVSLDDPGSFDAEVKALLEHLLDRLKRGVWEAWSSRYGYDIRPPSRKEGESDDDYGKRVEEYNEGRAAMGFLENTPEEKWARAYTEMFVFTPYCGIGLLATNLKSDDDMIVYKLYPKVHSVGVACQHLSTYGALTRGLPPASLSPGMDASPMNGTSGFPAEKKKSKEEKEKEKKEKEAPAPAKRPLWVSATGGTWREWNLQPGDVIAGDNVDPVALAAYEAEVKVNKDAVRPARDDFAHIASVLRRWPPGGPADAPYKLQWIDTGPLTAHGDKVTQDHDWALAHGVDRVAGTFAPATSRVGFGLIAEATDLADAAEKAYAALPLGFVRLVIASPDATVRFVSGMLPMWFGEARLRISDYLWSLRELPAEGLIAYWVIYAVMGEKLLDEVVKEAGGPSRSAPEIFAAADPANFDLRELAVVSSEPRVFRANFKSVDLGAKWVDVQSDPEGEGTEYGGDGTTLGGDALKSTEGQGMLAFRKWLRLRMGKGAGVDGPWEWLKSPKHADIELRMPDLSKVERDKEAERAAKEEEERARLEAAGKPVPEKKTPKEPGKTLDAAEVIETKAKDTGVPYFDLSVM